MARFYPIFTPGNPICMDRRIQAEVARAELDELGAKFYLDVRATVRRVLENMPGHSRAAFAAAATERVLNGFRPRDAKDVAAFADAARPLLDLVWRGLAGAPGAEEQVVQSVGQFYQSRYLCTHRHDDPANMADHVAMTALYSAECYLHGCWEFAAWVGWRAFDVSAIRAAADDVWPHRRPGSITAYAWELAHPLVQAELERQLQDLELLTGPTAETVSLSSVLVEQLRTP
jgi:hypothetical protein